MEPQLDPIGIDESFCFSCHPGVTCFNACCRDLNQFLTPYDILRLKNGLGISSGEFLKTYTIQHDGPESGLPVVTLKPGDPQEKTCPFLTPDGCRVYTDRPSSCRAYPLARAISRSRETGRITEHFAVIREAHCQGFSEGNFITVREWIEGQGLAEYFAMNDRLMIIISKKNQLWPGPLDLRERHLFHTALYNLDAFRGQVKDNALLEPLGIDAAGLDAAVSDDHVLLEWGHRWVAFALFGCENGER